MSKKQASVPVQPQDVPASSPAVTGLPADGEEFFMDMPRKGAAERLAAAERKRKAKR